MVRSRDCPYVGLDFYQEQYGSWFFGRELECDKIITNLQAARLTLLHAESGVGKSSLLRAGVAWRLRSHLERRAAHQAVAVDIPVVFSSWQDAPVPKLIGAIRQAIKPVLAGRSGPELPADRLDGAIEAAADATNAGLIVILDQFEEYFLYRSREPVPEQFADELARCVNRADLPANFLIAIREDAYAGLGDLFKGRIGNIYGNYLHIDYLDRASAERAIRAPLDVYNGQPGITERVEIQDELVEAVLDQVRARDMSVPVAGEAADADGDGRVATPLLQLVMETIWERERAAGSRELRLATLQNLQGVEKIVDTHVWKALRALDGRERQTAIDLFDHLVTPSGGKIAEPVPDLARRTGHSEALVGGVLDKLDHARIVRPVPAPPGRDPLRFRRYEIFHDVLTPTINRAIAVREEWRRTRRFRRLTSLVAVLLITSAAIGILLFVLYENASTQSHDAESGQLAAAAGAALARDPQRSVELALQALHQGSTSAADAALRDALPELQAVRTFQDGTVVFAAAFDPVDPNEIVSADKNGVARMWDVRTGRRLSLAGRPGTGATADTVAFSPDGTEVAVGYGNGMVAVFGVKTGNELQSTRAGSVINDIQFVGGTGELAIASQQGVSLWLLKSGSGCCDVLSKEQANTIAVDPGNPLKFAVATDQGTVIWTLGSNLRPLQHKSVDRIGDNDAEFNPDGREVVTAAVDGKVRVYDFASFRETMTFDAGEADAMSAAFSPDETRIVAAYSSGRARVWEVSTGLQLTMLAGNAAPVESARFNADGSEVVTADDDGTIRIWRAQPRELEEAFPVSFTGGEPNLPYPVYAVEYSPGGDRILAVDNSGAASVFTADGTPLYSPALPVVIYPGGGATVNSARFNHAGTEIVTADSDGSVDLWHASGQSYAQIHLPVPIHLDGAATHADFSPDGSRIVIVTSDDTAEVRSARSGALLRTLNPDHGFALSAAVFSPNGRQVLTGDKNGQVEVWEAATGKEIAVLGAPGPYISDVEFNRSGREFVTAADSGVVTVWSARDDRPVDNPINACPQAETASFSPDSTMIVVACGNGSLVVFDVATSQQLTAIEATDAGSVNSAEFSPDGRSIVTAIGGEDTGDVRVWDSGLATTSLRTLELDAAKSGAEPSPASSAGLTPAALNGTWNGSYVCRQGMTGLSLVIQALSRDRLMAAFNFFAVPGNLSVPSGSFTMTGTYSATGMELNRSHWITQPADYIMANLKAGPPTDGGTVLNGTVVVPGLSGCTTFSVRRSASSGSN